MATSDLLAELSKETFKPDSDGERKICKCVLKLLNDQSSDVQGLAVKWCVPRLPPAQGTSESLAHSALAPPASLTAARLLGDVDVFEAEVRDGIANTVLGAYSATLDYLVGADSVDLAGTPDTGSISAVADLGRAVLEIAVADAYTDELRIFRTAFGDTLDTETDEIGTIAVGRNASVTYVDGDATRTNLLAGGSFNDAGPWTAGGGLSLGCHFWPGEFSMIRLRGVARVFMMVSTCPRNHALTSSLSTRPSFLLRSRRVMEVFVASIAAMARVPMCSYRALRSPPLAPILWQVQQSTSEHRSPKLCHPSAMRHAELAKIPTPAFENMGAQPSASRRSGGCSRRQSMPPVASDSDQPWPIGFLGRAGPATPVTTECGTDLRCGEDNVDEGSDDGDARGRHQAHLAARRDETLHQRGRSTPGRHRPIKP